jgi:hypothetical protein
MHISIGTNDQTLLAAAQVRGWLPRMRFHVRFAVNRRCDLLHLRFGVRRRIATVYTYHAICCAIWCAQRQRAAMDTESHTKSQLQFGAKKVRK